MYGPGDAGLTMSSTTRMVLGSWQEVLSQAHAPYSVDDEIASGRQLIGYLGSAALPTRPTRWRKPALSQVRLTGLPDDVRAEFAAAAELPDGEPRLPTEAEIITLVDELAVSALGPATS